MTLRFNASLPGCPNMAHIVRYFGMGRVRWRRAMSCGMALLCAASWFAIAQDETDPAASRSKVLAFESAWGMAEKNKDAKALNELLDNSLQYTDYDGTMKTKSDFLTSLKAPGHVPDEETAESINARVYGNTAVVTGVYRVKGKEKGKAYSRRGRFADTWVKHDGIWVCVASQFKLIR